MISCKSNSSKKNVDVSSIQIAFKEIRFDRELFACDTAQLEKAIEAIGNKYPDFSNVYFKELTGFYKNNDQTSFLQTVGHFLRYKDYRDLYDTVQHHYPNMDAVNDELKSAFQHIHYYFPEQKWGTVYYFISGLNNWSAVTIDSCIGIGLDMHLGKQYPYYASVQLPEYQIARCEKEYIPINACKAIFEDMFPYSMDGKTMLDIMIRKGKEMLFIESILPNATEHSLIGYTPAQLAWCKDNEAMIWHAFAQQKLIYATNWQDIMPYLQDGPTSIGMPQESPGNIGTFIGWQIIHAYLQKHPSATLQEILNNQNEAQQFLQASSYRPK
jgi:hypothetical protein